MPLYSFQCSYSSASWKAQLSNHQDARARISGLLEAAGGKLIDAYYSFGEHDLLIIGDLPDNSSAAAVAIAANAGGAVANFKTSPLFTLEEGKQVLERASTAGRSYKAPVA
jgi:uncharacterized protein with GYD domain